MTAKCEGMIPGYSGWQSLVVAPLCIVTHRDTSLCTVVHRHVAYVLAFQNCTLEPLSTSIACHRIDFVDTHHPAPRARSLHWQAELETAKQLALQCQHQLDFGVLPSVLWRVLFSPLYKRLDSLHGPAREPNRTLNRMNK